MSHTVVLDELHLTIRIPATLPDAEVRAIRRTLIAKAFIAALRRAVFGVFRRYPPLASVRVVVSR